MYAYDDVTTTVWMDPDELKKMFRLPKDATVTGEVVVRRNTDGEVYNLGIKVTSIKYREQVTGKKRK